MPGSFVFNTVFTSDNFISQTGLSAGAGTGIDDPTLFSAIGGAFNFDNNDVRIASIAVLAGQTINLDVDFGSSNNIDTINTEIWLVDANGNIVATNDTSTADSGSTGTADPKLSYTSAQTGMLFAIVAQRGNDYIDGTFGFDNGGFDTGVFQMNVGIANLAALTSGTSGDDFVFLTNAERRYAAGAGNDSIYAPVANSTIDGGDGDDYLIGNSRSDILYGGNGNDSLYGYDNRDVLVGGGGDDNLEGGLARDELFGGEGGDSLYGAEGNDRLWGEDGNDGLSGGPGSDIVNGGAGHDYFYASTNDGNDTYDGGSGQDTYYAYNGGGALILDLGRTTAQATGAFGTDIVLNFEHVVGTNGFDDRVHGNAKDNSIDGYGGNDRLLGLGGSDYISGGAGNDELRGGGSNDSLYGGADDDLIYGDAGNDFLVGGTGKDRMWGGTDADNFYFQQAADSVVGSADIIHDFSPAEGDKINLQSLPGTLLFRGTGPFQNTGGEVRIDDQGNYQMVYVNLDTNPGSEMAIKVFSSTLLVETDFYL